MLEDDDEVWKMPISFSVVNAKGGVGKTTTAVNIAAMAAALPRPDGNPRRVLICDLDAQMNATHQLGFPDLEANQTLAGHVNRDAKLDDTIIHDAATIEGLDLLPSHYQLSYIDEAVLITGTWLRRKLKPFRSQPITEKTLCDWLRAGKVPGRKIGKVWRISEDALEDFLRGGPVRNSRGVSSNSRKHRGREQRRSA